MIDLNPVSDNSCKLIQVSDERPKFMPLFERDVLSLMDLFSQAIDLIGDGNEIAGSLGAKILEGLRSKQIKKYDVPVLREKIIEIYKKLYEMEMKSTCVSYFKNQFCLYAIYYVFYRALKISDTVLIKTCWQYSPCPEYDVLQFATQFECKELVEFLISGGINVNCVEDNDDLTALHMAAICGHFEIAQLLITHGANVNHVGDDGIAPLHYAAENGHLEIVKLLIGHGATVDVLADDERTPLYWAIVEGYTEIVKLLISHGANLHQTDSQSNSFLHIAVHSGHKKIAELLIENGIYVNHFNISGATALHKAVESGHKEIVELLIASGANINKDDKRGLTAIDFAVLNGHREIVELLIAKGASFCDQVNQNGTPLYTAIEKGYLEIAKLLIANGAYSYAIYADKDVHKVFNSLDLATNKEYKDIVDLIEANANKTRSVYFTKHYPIREENFVWG